jgi:hypothetical protein
MGLIGLRGLALVLLLGATCVVATGSAVDAASARPAGSTSALGHRLPASGGVDATTTRAETTADGGPVAVTGLGQTAASASSPVSARPGPQPSGGVGPGLATAAATAPPSPDWLTEINRYRAAAGLAPVSDQPDWDAGILDHLTYVAKTPKPQVDGAYASLHTENPASAYYTAAGARAGSRSDLYFGADDLSPVAFVDGWLSAPFHAIGLLRARLTTVAFASAGNGGSAGLDVISGLSSAGPATTRPILFPGDGMSTNLTRYTGSESPDPLETCGWGGPGTDYGVPLIALLPKAPAAGLSAQVLGADGSVLSTANGSLCVVDELTYRSSDSVYGPTGQQILHDDHAVLLIARTSYAAGRYTATITQTGRSAIAWSFIMNP